MVQEETSVDALKATRLELNTEDQGVVIPLEDMVTADNYWKGRLAGEGGGCVEATLILQKQGIRAVEESQGADIPNAPDMVDIDAVADMVLMLTGRR